MINGRGKENVIKAVLFPSSIPDRRKIDIDDEESCQEEVMWSEQVGFRHPVRIDITSS